jgi:HlyD family secretion protein
MKNAGSKGLHWGKKLWIMVVLGVLIGGGGFAAYTLTTKKATTTTTTPKIQTATARLGELSVFATGAGTIIPATQLSVGFSESGTLSEILFKVGDKVQAGDVIARLQTTNTEASIAAAIAADELSVLNAQKNLDDLNANSGTATADAVRAVEVAQKALDDLLNPELAIAQAKQAVVDAQKVVDDDQVIYNRAHMVASQSYKDQMYAEMLLAKASYERTKERFDKNLADLPADNLSRAQGQSALSTAEYNYQKAVASYNAAISGSSELDQAIAEADLVVAKAEFAAAQLALEQAQAGPTEGEIAVAKATLAAAQAQKELLKDGPNPTEVKIAEATLANAKAQLEVSKQKKVVDELVAPFAGTILSVDATVGESIGTTGIITLADLSQPMLQVYLDETDMDKVSIGLEADVVFDALPDQTFTGKVVEVNPSLIKSSNVSMVEVLVQLDTNSFAKPQTLPVGLNASVDVIGGRVKDAVLIPVEALRQIGTNEYTVFVVVNGELKLRSVTVGLMDLTSAQILTGLKAGEVVSTGAVATKQTTTTN